MDPTRDLYVTGTFIKDGIATRRELVAIPIPDAKQIDVTTRLVETTYNELPGLIGREVSVEVAAGMTLRCNSLESGGVCCYIGIAHQDFGVAVLGTTDRTTFRKLREMLGTR
ncbi:MAG: hypothetical protein V4773_01105 [Verrucomicrobiota bacterium]